MIGRHSLADGELSDALARHAGGKQLGAEDRRARRNDDAQTARLGCPAAGLDVSYPIRVAGNCELKLFVVVEENRRETVEECRVLLHASYVIVGPAQTESVGGRDAIEVFVT